jgi:hypothetical protein
MMAGSAVRVWRLLGGINSPWALPPGIHRQRHREPRRCHVVAPAQASVALVIIVVLVTRPPVCLATPSRRGSDHGAGARRPALNPAEGIGRRRHAVALIAATRRCSCSRVPRGCREQRELQHQRGGLSIRFAGLNMLTGCNGQISLGPARSFAIGAYTTAILLE